jgi:hypothetical protein
VVTLAARMRVGAAVPVAGALDLPVHPEYCPVEIDV